MSRETIETNKQMKEVWRISIWCREFLAKHFFKIEYFKSLLLNFCFQLGWKLEKL